MATGSTIKCAAFVLAVVLADPAAAQTPVLPAIATHDNLRSAGRLEKGVLSVALWAGRGRWYPEGAGPSPRSVEALGEEGGPLSVPSPLIRAPEGTVVHVTVRNTLSSPLRVHGLCDRPGFCEPLVVPGAATRDTRFTLHVAGTFHYWAETRGLPLPRRNGADSQLGGVIVAEPAGAAALDRLFVIGLMEEGSGESTTEVAVINGRSWPHTERLEYTTGDTVRWRVLNLSAAPHAMHLHGFYFRVESVGNGSRETIYAPADRRLAVTEQMPPGASISIAWVPERPGRWLFHCHMLGHMMPAHLQHDAAPRAHGTGDDGGMAGLVLGVNITGDNGAVATPEPDAARRQLEMVVEPDTRHGRTPSYKVDVLEGGRSLPRIADRAVPGPVVILTRGVPVAVDVVNRLAAPTAIHWHGIELESYDDGVPGYGGSGGSVTPPVAPGSTFTARFTPPRSGTFIYHTHWHDPAQLAGGVYGPLIVLEPGQTYDPAADHIIVLGLDGAYLPAPDEPFSVNGQKRPEPLRLKAGVSNRLRFINITADNVALTVQLLAGFDPVRWTLVAKDGSDTPTGQRTERPSRQLVSVGETYDFEVAPLSPAEAPMWMELRRGNGELLMQWPVQVR